MPSKSQAALLATLAIGVGVASYLIWYRKRRAKFRGQHTPDFFVSRQELVALSDDKIVEVFYQCTQLASQLQHLSNGDKLMLYGLYKQATVGDCSSTAPPPRINLVAHAKHTAWSKFQGMPQTIAIRYYIEAIQEFFNSDGDYDNDGYDDDDIGMESMGLRPSMPQQEDEDDDVKDESELSWNERLIRAAGRDDWNELKAALLNGAHVDATDEAGQTSLHFAADRGEAAMVKFLLEQGASPNATDNEGISVLQASVIAGNVEVTSMLLDAGADPDAPDMDGDTPRSLAEDDPLDAMKQLFASR